LKALGWVDIRHGGGTYINDSLPNEQPLELFHQADSLQEILDVRQILETGCVALASLHRTDEHLEQMDRILAKMKLALDTQDDQLSEQSDTAFHLQIARASQNSLLIQLIESLSAQIYETMRDTRRLRFY